MVFSRQARILTLLVIDTAFFFLEVIVGYAVGSLALVADSFHMLNDVLSLVVALYTIKLATSPSSAKNSYGWQRAEILGALINGVFLIALSVSIFLEAIGRMVSPPQITNPKLIVIVGSLGLMSNIVGLFLFHEHGHSHGHSHAAPQLPTDDGDATELQAGRPRADSMSSLYAHPAQTRAQVIETAQEFGYGRKDPAASTEDAGFLGAMSPPSTHHRASSLSRPHKRKSISRPRPNRASSANNPPAVGSNETLPPARNLEGSSTNSTSTTAVATTRSESPKISNGHPNHDHQGHDGHDGHDHSNHAKDVNEAEQGKGHSHSHDEGGHGGGHGHSHGSMNMKGVFLHVLGDALGNIGVITAGLIVWLAHGRWTLYFDPGVSLFITCIIFSSAIPLVRSASYILLQGVPSHISLDAVRLSIKSIAGVVSVHELHVWQLSESTTVASVHVMISPGVNYMDIAGDIREKMHEHGIHSVTIQPEFYTDDDDQSETACLIRCPPDECGTDTCCPPPITTGVLVDVSEQDEHVHEHEHGHDHDHSDHAH